MWSRVSVMALSSVAWCISFKCSLYLCKLIQIHECVHTGTATDEKGCKCARAHSLFVSHTRDTQVERLEGVSMKNLTPKDKCEFRAAKVQNLEKMLTVLREKRRRLLMRCVHACWSECAIKPLV